MSESRVLFVGQGGRTRYDFSFRDVPQALTKIKRRLRRDGSHLPNDEGPWFDPRGGHLCFPIDSSFDGELIEHFCELLRIRERRTGKGRDPLVEMRLYVSALSRDCVSGLGKICDSLREGKDPRTGRRSSRDCVLEDLTFSVDEAPARRRVDETNFDLWEDCDPFEQ